MVAPRAPARRARAGAPGHTGGVIVGIGVDVVDVARLAARLEAVPGLVPRLLTGAEAAACGGRARSVAARLAAKEAVLKALGGALADADRPTPAGWRYRDIEVRGGGSVPPRLVLSGVVASAAAGLGARRWHLSLAHDAGIAQAFVVAES